MLSTYQNQVHSWRTRSAASPTVGIFLIALLQFKYSFNRTLLSFTLFFPIKLFLENKRLSYWLSLLFFFFSCGPFLFFPQTAQGGGHRTLLYGHAILLRHSYSGMVSRRFDIILYRVHLDTRHQEMLVIAFLVMVLMSSVIVCVL